MLGALFILATSALWLPVAAMLWLAYDWNLLAALVASFFGVEAVFALLFGAWYLKYTISLRRVHCGQLQA